MLKIDLATDWQVSFGSPVGQPTSATASKLLWTDDDGLTLMQYGSDTEIEYQLQFWDEAVALIDPQQKTIHMHALSPDSTPATLEHLLHDQVFPRLLAHEGQLVVHAGAVAIEGRLALFLGESGLGKSTLVASLYQAGASLLGDDALLVSADHGSFYGQSLYRGLRLLPDSLLSLFPAQTETRPMAHYSSKQRLTIAVPENQNTSPQQLGALFFLEPPSSDQEITLRRMSPAESCIALIRNSFSLDPTDSLLARGKLQQASALANQIPSFALSYPRDYASLPQVHAKIRTQMAECLPRKTDTDSL
ncbi:hypothetical protein SAMN05216296_0890 [Pseudomonas pohangensis]|uniref:Hpr(Ser) kinase/phosphatase n=1 Tax=Pseudomonas pohangensis TaxID=364197 RepID=A0A1H2EMC1_9PSED|nr:hypothetical protein [Pseudomonas pohangensis]SDT95908.1 hypothetical protein SAMN05216296_0890 [Pseudomonas pohangensis]